MASPSVFEAGDNAPNVELPCSKPSDTVKIRHGRPIVLLVDDEPLILDTLEEILDGAGFDVLPASDGRTALELVAHRRPDFLLSDVLMPKMTGVELAIAVLTMYPSTRAVLFSGQAGISEILLDGRRRGFEFEMIAKPIHPLKVIEHLKGTR